MQLFLIEELGIRIRVEGDLNLGGGVYTHASHQLS
jgi:hypothetical protein